MKNILVPTDFSKQASYALDFALELAKKTDAKITVLNVVEMPISAAADPMGAPVVHDWGADFIKSITEVNRNKMKELSQKGDFDTQVEAGIMLDTALSFISNNNIDLVIMGTKGATGLKEIFIGSNAEKIVRYSPCPVVTIAYPAEVEDIDKIVFGIDLSGNEGKIVDDVKKLHDLLNATIHFIYINTPHVLTNEEEIIRKMRTFAEENEFIDYTVNIRKSTQRDSGIIEFAKEISADMIAMSSSRRKGLAHLFLGSLAEDLVNHSPMPVWTISLVD